MPGVSVIIPCYNGEHFVANAIDSALSQTYEDLEVIVVDDHSKDQSCAVIAKAAAKDPRVVPIYLDRNQGPSGARNAGLDSATGTWVALLDSDDLYKPERLHEMVRAAETANADFLIDNLIIKNIDQDQLGEMAFDIVPPNQSLSIDRRFFFDHLWMHRKGVYDLGYSKPLISKAFLDKNNLRYDEAFRLGEDIQLYTRAILRGARFSIIGNGYYIYQQRAGSLTTEGMPNIAVLVNIANKLLVNEYRLMNSLERSILKSRRNRFQRLINWRHIRLMRIERRWRDVLSFAILHPLAAYDLLSESLKWHFKTKKLNQIKHK